MVHATDGSLGRSFNAGPFARLYHAPTGNDRWGQGFTAAQLGVVDPDADRPGGYFSGVDNYAFGHRDWIVQCFARGR